MNRRDFDFGSDGLDATVLDLIDAEQRHPGPPPGSETRVRAAVAASIAAAALVSSTAAASTAAAATVAPSVASSSTMAASTAASTAVVSTAATSLGAKLGGGAVVVAAIAATAGGGLYVSSYELEPTSTEKPAVVVMADEPKPTPPAGLVIADGLAETETAPTSTSTIAKPRATTIEATRVRAPRSDDIEVAPKAVTAPVVVDEPARVAALAAERRQLGLARGALTANDGRQALALLDAHRASWPEGQLVEEREALRVLALAQIGSRDEARAASSSFKHRWPTSLFLDAIDRAVGR